MSADTIAELKKTCELPDSRERKLKAARFCRDRLDWAVHPLCGPNDLNHGSKARGKKPLLKDWPAWTVQRADDEFLNQHFGNGHDANLGIVVRRPHVCVDLDSKSDKGRSVMEWLKTQPELAKVPRERTAGGVHLHFKCPDLPPITKNGKPYARALVAKINDSVTAELLFDGLNVVIAPSVHADGFTYCWEVTGEIPEFSWQELQDHFGFRLPSVDEETDEEPSSKSGKPSEWWQRYEGDLKTLNLAKLFESFGLLGETVATDQGKIAVKCPWHAEHSNGNESWKPNDSSTVIFPATGQNGWPGFHCSHAHCAGRKLKDVLEWCEQEQPGIVDQHCARKWVWTPGQTSEDGRPRVVLPGYARPDSLFATEVGKIIAPKKVWFSKDDRVVALRVQESSETVKYLGFHELSVAEVCTAIEYYVETGRLQKNKSGQEHFVPGTMNLNTAKKLNESQQFKRALPKIIRILDVQLPVLHEGKVVYPKKGYDERFHTYCDPSAPEIIPMTLDEALKWLRDIHDGFCWKDQQDLRHAIARLITPLARGLMGWQARPPLWLFEANRPRAGKDYLAGITMLVYEGYACEDAPLSNKDSEETRKRITTALLSGRRMMHFANCQGYLESKDLQQAVTSCVWADRRLGGNTEAKLPNELEFSLSANLGLTYREDFEPRMRKIRLSYPQEDANSRTFPKPNLHEFVYKHRGQILSAIGALIEHWGKAGSPSGPTPFTSFPDWARVVGGIMHACDLGDPCLPHEDDADIGGDQFTRAMKEVFRIGFEAKPQTWLEKREIYALIAENAETCDPLSFFGDLSDTANDSHSSKTKFGRNLSQFVGRELGGIRLERMAGGNRSDRAKFRFIKPERPSQDRGSEISQGLFGGGNPPPTPPPNGDLGDVGDVQHPSNSKQEDNLIDDKQNNMSPQTNGGGKGLQGLQRLHPSGEPPTLLTHLDDLAVVASALRQKDGPIALDIETYGKDARDPYNGDIRLLTLANGEQSWMLDLRAIGYALGPLKPVLETAEVIGHNLKFDTLWLQVKCGVSLSKLFCTMTASRLLTAGSGDKNDLGECLHRYLGVDLPKDQATSDWAASVLSDAQLQYARNDVLHLVALRTAMQAEIQKHGLEQALELELNLLPKVVAMEARGFAVDRDKLQVIRETAEGETRDSLTTIRQHVEDPDFNPASPDQLLEKLKARNINLPNTKEETLVSCSDPLASEILGYRGRQKAAQQAESLLKAIGKDGRIHACFNPTGTETGRFSSSKPNLQNIGRGELRECFVASPGKALVIADYSQIELRAAAAIAGEEEMLKAYRIGIDLHKQTASLILAKPLGEITKEDRQLAKAVNFGLLYGQRAKGLVRYAKTSYGVKLSEAEAQQFLQRFFDAYQGLKKWHAEAWRNARSGATEVRTVTGRRRLLPQGSENEWERFTGLVNTVVQGGCADGLKLAMVELSGRLPVGAGIISTIHDELVVEALVETAEQTKQIVEECMKQAMQRLFPRVPIEVEIKICSNWGEK